MLFKLILCIILVSNWFKYGGGDPLVEISDGKEYILSVVQEFVYEIENYGLCNFEFTDLRQNISSTTNFGYNVTGTVDYKNGFVHTVSVFDIEKEPGFNGLINENEQTAQFISNFRMRDVQIFFDYKANLTEKQFSGTVLVPVKDISFSLEMKHFYANDTTISLIRSVNLRTDVFGHNWNFVPANHYTQIINEKAVTVVTNHLRENFENIAETKMSKLLKNVAKNIPFPVFHFYIPEGVF